MLSTLLLLSDLVLLAVGLVVHLVSLLLCVAPAGEINPLKILYSILYYMLVIWNSNPLTTVHLSGFEAP